MYDPRKSSQRESQDFYLEFWNIVPLFLQSVWYPDATPGTSAVVLPPCSKAAWIHWWHTEQDRSHTPTESQLPDLTAPEACLVTPLYCLIILNQLKSYWCTAWVWPSLRENRMCRISSICSSRFTLPLCSPFCASWGWTILTPPVGTLASDFHLDLTNRKPQ